MSRERSSRPDLLTAVEAAMNDGATHDLLIQAMRVYFASAPATKDDGMFVKGVHRMIQKGKWRDWLPEPGEELAGPGGAAGAALSAGDHAAFTAHVWRTRMEDFKRIGAWSRSEFGAQPGEKPWVGVAPCKCPQAILEEFGYAPV